MINARDYDEWLQEPYYRDEPEESAPEFPTFEVELPKVIAEAFDLSYTEANEDEDNYYVLARATEDDMQDIEDAAAEALAFIRMFRADRRK